MPNRCTKKAVNSKTEDAAKFTTAKKMMNFNIYYPTDDLESNPMPALSSYHPGFPTVAPTTIAIVQEIAIATCIAKKKKKTTHNYVLIQNIK